MLLQARFLEIGLLVFLWKHAESAALQKSGLLRTSGAGLYYNTMIINGGGGGSPADPGPVVTSAPDYGGDDYDGDYDYNYEDDDYDYGRYRKSSKQRKLAKFRKTSKHIKPAGKAGARKGNLRKSPKSSDSTKATNKSTSKKPNNPKSQIELI